MNLFRSPFPHLLHWLAVLAAVVSAVAGAVLLHRSTFYPVYTVPDAPSRVYDELVEFDKQEPGWYDRLAAYETPHKRLHDQGFGLLALGGGILLAGLIARFYSHRPERRRPVFFMTVWFLLWVLPIPLSYWYYRLRQARFDYPPWGDSILIPIFTEAFACGFGCIVLGILVRILMIRHELPGTFEPRRPRGVIGWIRCVFIVLWILLLFESVRYGVTKGSVGSVLSALGFVPLMLAVLWAVPRRDLSQTEAAPAVEALPREPG